MDLPRSATNNYHRKQAHENVRSNANLTDAETPEPEYAIGQFPPTLLLQTYDRFFSFLVYGEALPAITVLLHRRVRDADTVVHDSRDRSIFPLVKVHIRHEHNVVSQQEPSHQTGAPLESDQVP